LTVSGIRINEFSGGDDRADAGDRQAVAAV
jgi:hypothetical protein